MTTNDNLEASEWAELANLLNVAAHHQIKLVPLRDKVRDIATRAICETVPVVMRVDGAGSVHVLESVRLRRNGVETGNA